MINDKILKEFEKWGKRPPSSEPHGTEEDIRNNMKQLLPNQWRLEGNILKGKTQMGELVQRIPTDYILKGTDERGLPILEKIKL